jgi:hypothetical protein
MADEKSKAADKPKPIIDVAHPGQSAPSPTTKSILINNHALLKDPMVVEAASNPEDGDAPAPPKPAAAGPSRVIIKPIHDDVEPEVPAEEPTEEPAGKAAEPAPALPEAPAAAAADDPEPAAPAEPDPEPASSPAKPADDKPDAPADTADPAKEEPDKTVDAAMANDKQLADQQAAEAEHEAAMQKLIDSQQYFLPINTVEKRKAKRFMVLGVVLAVVLAAAWADIALDAGLIHVSGVKPATHFFSN